MPRNTHDIEWLGLELTNDALRATLPVQARHLNVVDSLYGGTAVATAITLMEEASGGSTAWVTVQFAASCGLGDVLDLQVAVPAAGHRTSQLRVSATLAGREIFTALGATRAPRPEEAAGWPTVSEAPGWPTVCWEAMPDVPPPERCQALPFPAGGAAGSGGNALGFTEYRIPPGPAPDGRLSLWCRPIGTGRLSAAVLGWQSDLIGLAMHGATGATGSTSLDNTVRFGPPADPVDDWVLADLRSHLAVDGVGHGTTFLWSTAGDLLAVASQSCLLRR